MRTKHVVVRAKHIKEGDQIVLNSTTDHRMTVEEISQTRIGNIRFSNETCSVCYQPSETVWIIPAAE